MSEQFRLKEAQAAWVKAWVEERDASALEHLLQSVHTLILIEIKAARRHSKTIDVQDLYQEARIGVMRAADKFDPSVGAIFGAYARWYIREGVQQAAIAADTQASVKRSKKDRRIHLQVRGIVTSAEGEGLGTERGIEFAAEKLKISRDHAARAFSSYQRVNIAGCGAEDEVGFELESGDPGAGDVLDASRLPDIIEDVLTHVCRDDERTAWIVRERYRGGPDGEGASYDDIAVELGIGRERVRQIYVGALADMAKALKRRGLGLSDLVG